MMGSFTGLVAHDIRLAWRQGADAAMTLFFFVVVVTLFPLGVGPEPLLLERMASGVVWVAALLSAMLSLDRIFLADHQDGTMDLLLLAPQPLSLIVLAKTTAHWLTTGLPIILISPLLALLMNLPTEAYGTLLIAMALGTPVISLLGSVGAALVLGSRRAGVLVALLVLPLTIPVLIFGVGAVEAAATGLTPRPHLLLLAAMLAGSLPLCPWAAAAALRQTAE
jgi:heme exporter protein B